MSAVLLTLSGCFASLDRSKAIEVEQRWYGERYSQRGERLSLWRMMDVLESEDAARPHVQRWRRSQYAGMAMAMVGGASLGLGTAMMSGPDQATGKVLLGLAAALWLPVGILSSTSLSASQNAVEAHNSSLRAAAPSETRCELHSPWIAVLPYGQGGRVQAAGLDLAF